MVNTTDNSTEDMTNKLQQLMGKTKSEFSKNINNYYDKMNVSFNEDPFAKNVQVVNKIYQEVLKLMKFLQTKPEVKNMNINYYDSYYTVFKSIDGKEILHDKYENEFIIPNHYVGIKPRETILR